MIPEIRFANNSGTVQIAGGISPLLSPTFVSGLTLPEKEVNTAVFKNAAGRKLISLRDKARLITVEGILEKDLSNAAHILYSPGTLIFKTDRMKRVISARCTSLSDRRTDGKIIITFDCDNPYFHDDADLHVPVYSRVELVSSPFTLPCIFTKRIREGNCINQSTVPCEPEIIITNKGENAIEGFTVTNEDTGISVIMSATVNPEETISINIEERTVTSDTGENLLPFLAETSYLHEFILMPGDNHIKLYARDGLECEIIYNTNYTEAVI